MITTLVPSLWHLIISFTIRFLSQLKYFTIITCGRRVHPESSPWTTRTICEISKGLVSNKLIRCPVFLYEHDKDSQTTVHVAWSWERESKREKDREEGFWKGLSLCEETKIVTVVQVARHLDWQVISLLSWTSCNKEPRQRSSESDDKGSSECLMIYAPFSRVRQQGFSYPKRSGLVLCKH